MLYICRRFRPNLFPLSESKTNDLIADLGKALSFYCTVSSVKYLKFLKSQINMYNTLALNCQKSGYEFNLLLKNKNTNVKLS